MEPLEKITSRILFFRGQRVLLDEDLADLYGVSTGRFNERYAVTEAASPAISSFS